MSKIKMSLLENSNSFLIESLSKAIVAENEPIQWKFSILSLIQAIELAFKERLRQEHSILIYSNIDTPRHTVSLETALDRLKNICKLEFSDKDINAVRTALQWRNLITHYEFEFSTQTIKGVFATLLGFLIDFSHQHLNQDLRVILPADLWSQAVSIRTYFNELLQRASKRISDENLENSRRSCKQCGADTFVVFHDSGTNSPYGICYLCGYGDNLVYCDVCTGTFSFDETELIEIGDIMDGGTKMAYVCKAYCLPKFK